MKINKIAAVAVGCLAIGALGGAQIKQVIKLFGIGAAVKQFGPQINTEINKLTRHKDSNAATTRVVPILRITVNGSNAIGAAQILGPKSQVDKVYAVAAPEAVLFGEITIRGLVPVDSKASITNLKSVDGVAVSGIIDLKL